MSTRRQFWIAKVCEDTFSNDYVVLHVRKNKKITAVLPHEEMEKIYEYVKRAKEAGFWKSNTKIEVGTE